MRNRYLVPRPWWQVGLTVLPGLIFLLRQIFSPPSPWDAGLHALFLGTMILLSLSSVLLSAMRRSLKVPVWGLIPLGLFAGMGLMATIDPFRFYPTCFLLAVIGLLFARHNGLSASLFVLAGGIITASWAVEPAMYFWDSPLWSAFINVGLTVLLTILTPILLLRSGSILGRVVGLLSPMAAYCAAFVCALSRVRGVPVSQSAFRAGPFIALMTTVAIAAAAYEWISSRDFTVGEAQKQGAV
jgi:hypothetical protein